MTQIKRKRDPLRSMRKIVVSEFVTLDGVMEEPHWTFQFPGNHMLVKSDELFASDSLLLGRVTYEGFAAAWPTMKMEPMDYANKMNSIRKYVVSTTMKDAKWNNSKMIKQNVAEEVQKLKEEEGSGNILVYGSRTLVNYLAQHDLVDEYWLMVFPIVVGKGKRLFADGTAVDALKLVEARTFDSGVVVLHYDSKHKQGEAVPEGIA
jgi:dihydrofolate reductase